MRPLKILADLSETEGLRFLVVGGHAMIAHGSTRITGDIDVSIIETDLARWCHALAKAGYTIVHQTDAFVQFRPPSRGQYPIDLMIVDAQTFEKMWRESVGGQSSGTPIQIPHPEHLIGMKIHALKYGARHRHAKDLGDVIHLMRRFRIDPNHATFKELSDRYGTPQIEAEIRTALQE